MKGRARTGPGRPSALPPGPYSSPEPVRHGGSGAEVAFTGDDGRRRVFGTTDLALPGWRAPVAAAFAARTGISGGLRTPASAEGAWQTTRRFTGFLSLQQPPPSSPGDLPPSLLGTAPLLLALDCRPGREISRAAVLAESTYSDRAVFPVRNL